MKNKDKLLKRIEQTEDELKKLKVELNKEDHPEYVEITGFNRKRSYWYTDKVGQIFNVEYLDSKLNFNYQVIERPTDLSSFIRLEDCKSSTKEAFDAQNEIIRVPDCIEFEIDDKDNVIGIQFNDNKQILSFYNKAVVYSVTPIHSDKLEALDNINFKLTKCGRSDLRAGDVAFRSNCIGPNFRVFTHYCIILEDGKYSYIHCSDIMVAQSEYDHWYKVEKI